MRTCLLVQLYIYQLTVLLMVLCQHTLPIPTLLCVCPSVLHVPPPQSHLAMQVTAVCPSLCNKEGKSRSLRVLFSSSPISYFSHTHAKVSLGIVSPSRLLKLWVTIPQRVTRLNVQVVKNLSTSIGFLNTQQPKFNQNQMLGKSKEFLVVLACAVSCDFTAALVLKTAHTLCSVYDITVHNAWKISAQIWDYCVMNYILFPVHEQFYALTETWWFNYGKQRLLIFTYLCSLDYIELQFPSQL